MSLNYIAKTIIDEENRGFVILTYPSGCIETGGIELFIWMS
jgi:hypothetical protein